MDTPFQWTKQVASHFGGTRNGLVISWPARIKDRGGIRSQFHHVIDIVPDDPRGHRPRVPGRAERRAAEADRGREHGLHLRRREGAVAPHRRSTSSWPATAPSTRTAGSPAPRRCACRGSPPAATPIPTTSSGSSTTSADDFSQADDLAAPNPAKLKELQAAFDRGARRTQRLSARLELRRAREPGDPAQPDPRAQYVHLLTRARFAFRKASTPDVKNSPTRRRRRRRDPRWRRERHAGDAGRPLRGWGLMLVDGRPTFVHALLEPAAAQVPGRLQPSRSPPGKPRDPLRVHL